MGHFHAFFFTLCVMFFSLHFICYTRKFFYYVQGGGAFVRQF